MPLRSRALSATLTTLALALSTTACVIETSSSSSGYGGYDGPDRGETPRSNPSPVLIEVDTNAKLEADPGAGVGVFIEYGTGGKWHIFWACDTNETGRPCDYQVKVRPSQGKLTSVVDDGGRALPTTGGEISLRRVTSTKNDGMRFDGDPGAVITLEVTLDGRTENVFFFFVQNGTRNGGYEGALTNPIKLQGKTP